MNPWQGPCLSSLYCSKDKIHTARGDFFIAFISIFFLLSTISFSLSIKDMLHLGPGTCPSLLGYQSLFLPTLGSSLVLVLVCSAMQEWFIQRKDTCAGITCERNCHFYKFFLGAFIDPVIVNKSICRKRVEDFFYNNFFQEPLIWWKMNRMLLIYIV